MVPGRRRLWKRGYWSIVEFERKSPKMIPSRDGIQESNVTNFYVWCVVTREHTYAISHSFVTIHTPDISLLHVSLFCLLSSNLTLL